MAQIKFYRGLYKNYSTSTHADGIYFATDNHCIMMNGIQYGGVDNAMFEGFIKDVDVDGNVLSFKKDVKGTWTDVSIKLLEAVDKSIVLGTISNDGVNDGSTIKVNVKEVGDADGLKLGDDGLYVDLTKTTKAITDEVSTARAAEKKNADAITAENDRATKVEDKIESSVGLATDGSHVTTKGNYTKAATTVVGEIAALDTQVKTNADGIAENKLKISTLNGSDTVTGSVDNKIKVALTWEDVK